MTRAYGEIAKKIAKALMEHENATSRRRDFEPHTWERSTPIRQQAYLDRAASALAAIRAQGVALVDLEWLREVVSTGGRELKIREADALIAAGEIRPEEGA